MFGCERFQERLRVDGTPRSRDDEEYFGGAAKRANASGDLDSAKPLFERTL